MNKKKRRLFSKSNPKSDLNKAKNLYFYQITKKSKPNQQIKNVKFFL